MTTGCRHHLDDVARLLTCQVIFNRNHFSHPFLGTCEVYEFFDLGVPQWYPFQGGI